MYDDFRLQAGDLLETVLTNKGIKVDLREPPTKPGLPMLPPPVYTKVKFDDLLFEEPPAGMGDLATSICFTLAKTMKKSPPAIADELVKEIDLSTAPLISDVKAVKGYINFYLDYKRFSKELIKKVVSLDADYGRGREKGKIILEHTSANPDGPLHIGHGRNSIIGDSLARILRFSGFDVEVHFYVNDMGRQLALVVFGLRKMELDKSEKKDDAIAVVYGKANVMVEEEPAYEQEISKIMRSYEAGDKETVEEFRNAADYCLDGMRETLKLLGVTHDTFVWESQFVRDLSVKKLVEKLKKSKYARQNEVLYLDLKEFGIEKELVLIRKDGTYLYTTRDLAYHIWKESKGKVIDIWGADHKLVAQQLSAALKILGEKEPEFIIYEFISLPEGKMSTRKGVYISVDELVDESIRRAYMEVEKRRPDAADDEKKSIARVVGVGAVRYNIARISPEKGMIFKWEEALDFERQGAPFIQYAHARACRILEKTELNREFNVHELSDHEKNLVLIISKFSTIVKDASETRKPAFVAAYVLALADSFNRFYKFEPVLKSEEKDFRLNLVEATRITLRNALALLGIEAPERM